MKVKTEGEIIREHIEKLKKAGAICCSRCGLPSGLKNVILVKTEDGKYVCFNKCPKVPE